VRAMANGETGEVAVKGTNLKFETSKSFQTPNHVTYPGVLMSVDSVPCRRVRQQQQPHPRTTMDDGPETQTRLGP
jgi:hypothetical protein